MSISIEYTIFLQIVHKYYSFMHIWVADHMLSLDNERPVPISKGCHTCTIDK